MKATSIRSLLIMLIIILIAAVGGGFYLGLQQVKTFAIEVNHTVADSNASGENVVKLHELKQALAQRETLVDKANKLFSTEQNYQSQALKDIQKYASDIGLTISNTNFDTKAPNATAVGAPSSSRTFIITIQSPVDYKKLLQFLDALEGNLPKMQVVSISLSRPTSGSVQEVVIGDTTIAISTR